MTRKRRGRPIHGILLLDKPSGISSNLAVQQVKRLFRANKAGHTGSLDPFATGMLPICLGEASKTAGFMLESSKTYRATARLGISTRTGDTEGDVIDRKPVPELKEHDIETVFQAFLGQNEQVPPMYSALKHEGQPLYKLAREGREVPRKPRLVIIYSLKLLSWDDPLLQFVVHCSKGTYIRTLAEDLAIAFGSNAHLQALRRCQVEPFVEHDMVTLDELEAAADAGREDTLLLPVDAGLVNWPVVKLAEAEQTPFVHGNPVPSAGLPGAMVRVYSAAGGILGVGDIRQDGKVYPKRVFRF